MIFVAEKELFCVCHIHLRCVMWDWHNKNHRSSVLWRSHKGHIGVDHGLWNGNPYLFYKWMINTSSLIRIYMCIWNMPANNLHSKFTFFYHIHQETHMNKISNSFSFFEYNVAKKLIVIKLSQSKFIHVFNFKYE